MAIQKIDLNCLINLKNDINTQGLFLTYKVGSEGLNLTEATHCDMYRTMVDQTQFTTKPKQDFGEQVKLNRYTFIM